MTKAELKAYLDEYISIVKERAVGSYVTSEPHFEAMAIRSSELIGAIQAAESFKDFIEETMEEE